MTMRTVFLLAVLFAACIAASSVPAEAADSRGELETVVILKTTQGDITLRFFPDKAPEHVKNFITHCRTGFYRKTYFHRVYPDFMIQGGDPNTKDRNRANDGKGGYSYKGKRYKLKAEFNDIPHLRGVLSMAREADPDSAGSQFFIMVKDNHGLDGKYSAFGRVIEGMDVVDKIVVQPGDEIPGAGGFNPKEPQVIENIVINKMGPGEIYLSEARQYGPEGCLRPALVTLETSLGAIGITLRPDKAPSHALNFILHCSSGFYDGTAFHRVVPELLIHGGDPNTTNADPADDGLGGHSHEGPGRFLKDEFSDLAHVRGTVTMARGKGPDSAGSQFLVLVGDQPEFDGNHSAFGSVVFGIEVADEISKLSGDELADGEGVRPSKPVVMKSTRVDYLTPVQIRTAARQAEQARVRRFLETPKGGQHVAVLETNHGKIVIRFFPDKAPIHVHNFLENCRSGLYENTYFHRVMPGFMIQGGDPNTKDDDFANDGKGGLSYKGEGSSLPAEFSDIEHVRGIVSMARGSDPDSATSQFFIMVANNPSLNGKYSAFGKVISGMDAVDKIVSQKGVPIPGVGGVNPEPSQYILSAKVEIWTDKQVSETERKR